MSFHADIKLGVKINNVDYDINVSIPNSAPTNDKPYAFSVVGSAGSGDKSSDSGDKSSTGDDQSTASKSQNGADDALLTVVVGDKDNYFVSVAPPKEILAATSGTVSDLSVSVNEGDYDVKTGKFAGKADDSSKAAPADSSTAQSNTAPASDDAKSAESASPDQKSAEPASSNGSANDGAAS